MWYREEAIVLCKKIETICPDYGCHVALTGGTLYKEGARKDIDLLFYRIRQAPKIDTKGLFKALEEIGIKRESGYGWCHKAKYMGGKIDIFFPEEESTDAEFQYVGGV